MFCRKLLTLFPGEIFRNRKVQFPLNVQVACRPNLEMLNLVARHPGSTHDNAIFEQSGLRVKFESNEVQGILLGDNGYACRRDLLTPVINPVTESEENYNRAHIRTRNIVERVFGVCKRRFPCLRRTLQTEEETSIAIICATAILHNIARNLNDVFQENELNEDGDWVVIVNDRPGDGLAFRRTFIVTHF
ncbi:unnamed protein product [Acanthoscelides obtectus]|uniref:DDE Tnp4 domain-containing protein n=1 Tax=Acanthoscelides obtectus TaxID=200917 RepID=A0A9P0MES7_ACAOB|nr:unnamed protein product [Acanthoscelides obtectus]CAK1657515.1 Putative nuclease HARBI1 [Acanthoscelides obtectus]